MRSVLARIYAFAFAQDFVLIYPLYAVMFVDHGLTPVQISLCLTAWSVTGFLLEIPSGVWADRFPRKWLLSLAQGLRAIGYALWLLWPTFPGFLIGFILWGAKSALTSGTYEALIYDELKAAGHEADYTRVLGRTQALSFTAQLAAGGGAALLAAHGYPLLLLASVAAVLAAAVIPLTLPDAPRNPAADELDYWQHLRLGLRQLAGNRPLLRLIAFIAFVESLGSLDEYWSIFADRAGLTHAQNSVFFAILAITQGAGALLAHRWAALKPRWLYTLLIIDGLLLVAAAAAFGVSGVGLLIAFSGLFKLVDVINGGRLQDAVPDETRATLSSVTGFATEIGVTAIYLSVGVVAAAAGWRGAFGIFGALIAAIALAFLLWPAREPGRLR